MPLAGITRPVSKAKYGKYKKRKPSVKVSVPKRRKPRASYTRNNSKAINALGRQVKALQMARYGNIQTNLQVQQPTTLIPTQSLPILTDLADFTCARDAGDTESGAKYYQYSTAGVLTQAALWQTSPLGTNAFWQEYNINRPGEKGQYLPIRAEYSVTITGAPSLDNTRVRFDLFMQKPDSVVQRTTAQTANQLRLPTALNELGAITSPEINRLNPQYFKKYWTKVFFINSSKTNADTKGTTGNQVRFRFSIHPKKPRQQLEIAPNPVPDTVNAAIVDALNEHIDHSDHSSDEADAAPPLPADTVALDYGPYNTVIGSQLWLLISTDDLTSAGIDAVHVNLSRRITWRDHEGTRAA